MADSIHAVVGTFKYVRYSATGMKTEVHLPRTYRLTPEQSEQLLALLKQAEALTVPEYQLHRWARQQIS